MKMYLLAAAALIAAPTFAQTMPPAPPAPADQTMPAPADQTMTPPAGQTMPADPAMPAPPAPPADPAMTPAPADPAMMPPPPAAPGTGGVVFGQPTMTPPTPAPAEYPRCSRTVTDGCVQRGGK